MVDMTFNFKSWEEIPVGIYAIAHNEGKFVKQWLESMSEADKIYVYENNNSTDDTWEQLVEATKDERYKGKLEIARGEVKPFYFDKARNQGMEMIPAWGEAPDACYALWCTDLDETLTKGWADAYRKAIFNCKGQYSHIYYKYAWNHDELGNPGRVFWYDKTILNDGYWKWDGCVHEWQTRKEGAPEISPASVYIDDGSTIWLHHWADPTKSRGSYLGLLEKRVEDNPDDLNARAYLVRELQSYGRWRDSLCQAMIIYIDAQKHRMNAPDLLTNMAKEIAYNFSRVGCEEEAEFFFKKAISYEPRLKDNYMQYAQFLVYHGRPLEAMEQLSISKQKASHLDDWRELDYMWSEWKECQIKADCYAWLGDYDMAWKIIQQGKAAIKTQKDITESGWEGFWSDYSFIEAKYRALHPEEFPEKN